MKLHFASTLGSLNKELEQSEMREGVGLAIITLGTPMDQVEGSTGDILPGALGVLPAGVIKMVSRNHILLVPFDICICLYPSLLPPLTSQLNILSCEGEK